MLFYDKIKYLFFENRKIENKIIKWEISKEYLSIETNSTSKLSKSFKLYYLIMKEIPINYEHIISSYIEVYFSFNEIKIEDVYLKLNKLIEHESDKYNYFAYETNITEF